MITTSIRVPDDDPNDIEIVVKREDDLIVVGFFGYAAVDRDKRYGWQVYLTPDKAEILMRGLQDLGGPAHPGASSPRKHPGRQSRNL